MDLVKLNRNLKRIDVEQIAVQVLKKLNKFISDLNREQLALRGENDDGEKLEPEYTTVTKIIKNESGRGTGSIISHVTLFDKGNLHKSIFSTVDKEEIILGSNDSKVGELTQKYGEFLGLTPDSIEKLKAKFLPLFWESFYAKLYK
ncbi:hypothetical protein DRO61_11630 [Candidatus Bathyarchaeota archaeon]|nr:MAG: hypothetical protein DRO61_11630 [Candidatus Bathyarchaeota archaeon]